MSVSPVVARTIADQITGILRQEILAGEFETGSPIRESELAERFQVSRHPIRKVLQQLTLEGLLVSKPNCGVTVAGESTDLVPGLLTPMRVQLELFALRKIPPTDFKTHQPRWEKLIRQMTRAAEEKDEHAILSLDAEFHQHILIAAGMDDCISLWQSIYSRMRGHHRQSNRKHDDLRFIPHVHEHLLASFLNKPIEEAAIDLQSHLENTDFNRRILADWNKRERKGAKR